MLNGDEIVSLSQREEIKETKKEIFFDVKKMSPEQQKVLSEFLTLIVQMLV